MIMPNRGFTLVELLITIAIILIISGIVAPRFDFGFKNQRLEADSKKLASNITLAQQYAMGQKNGHRYYGIGFYNSGYRIISYSDPDTPIGPVFVPSSNVNGDIPFSEGISISGAEDIIFDFRGSTLLPSDIQIVLSIDSATKTITITHLTGHVTVE